MRESQVVSLLADLCAAYAACNPNGAGALSEETRAKYVELLCDLDYDMAREAVNSLIQENKFFPAIAEIRNEILSRQTGLETDPEIAWAEVMVALRKHGRTKRPCFFNAATEAAVFALGWTALCNSDESSLFALRSQFFRIYTVCLKRINAAITDGRITLGTGEARKDALKAAGARQEFVFKESADDPALPAGVAELRTLTGRVMARVDVREGER